MPEIKYYIVYADWRPEYQGPEDFNKAMKEYSQKIEEAGCKVVYWGATLGVSESALCVIKGTTENWMKIPVLEAPYTNTRTNLVVTF